MQKVLILGSRGFIGRNLKQKLSKNYIVGEFSEMINNGSYDFFKKFIKEFEPHFVLNCTGSGNVRDSLENPMLDFEKNVSTTLIILEAIRTLDLDIKFLHFSSAAIYGNPVNEISAEMDLKQPISPYGYHKCISEDICRSYFANFNIPISIVRPFSVYGNGQRKMLLWDLMKKINEKDVVELFGTGCETRDFIHISDVCNAVELILVKSNFQCDFYNIANGIGVEISKVASVFSSRYKNKKIFFNRITREGDPVSWCADIAKIKMVGYKQQIELEKGIEDYISWYESFK
jgi:dTDP-glucose 4,6-dehydratase/UDP-glucose 4-epimerase